VLFSGPENTRGYFAAMALLHCRSGVLVLFAAVFGAGSTYGAFVSPLVSLRTCGSPLAPQLAVAPLRPARVIGRIGVRSFCAVAASAAPNGVANKVALVALGCPKNTVDAEVMLGDLQKKGFQIVRQPRDADVVIVNTCTFVEVHSSARPGRADLFVI